MEIAAGVAGDDRLPVVRTVLGHESLRAPRTVFVDSVKNVEATVADALPDDHDASVRHGDAGDLIGAGVVGEALGRGPGPAGVACSAVEVPVAVDLRRPNNPDERVAVHSDSGFVVVAGGVGDGHRRRPVGLPGLDRAGKDEAAVRRFGVRHPGDPRLAPVRGKRRVVVFAQTGGEFGDFAEGPLDLRIGPQPRPAVGELRPGNERGEEEQEDRAREQPGIETRHGH